MKVSLTRKDLVHLLRGEVVHKRDTIHPLSLRLNDLEIALEDIGLEVIQSDIEKIIKGEEIIQEIKL